MPDPVEPIAPATETPAVPAAPVTPEAATLVTPKSDNPYADELAAKIASANAIYSAKDEPVAASTDAAPEPEAEVVTEPVAVEEPVIEPVAEPEAPAKIEVPEAAGDRIRFKDAQDEKIAKLKRDHPEMSFAQCEQFIKGTPPAATEAPVAEDPEAIELTEIEAKLNEHAEAGSLMTPEIRSLQRRESELLAKREAQALVAPIMQKEAEREVKAFNEARAASVDRVQKSVAAMYQEGTPLNEEAREIYANMQNPEHPDYIAGIAKKPNAPELVSGRALNSLAEKIAARDGISFADAYAAQKGNPISVQPVKTAAPTTKPVPPVTAARKPAVTAPGNVATRTPDRAKSPDEVQAELDAMNPIQRFEALFGKKIA